MRKARKDNNHNQLVKTLTQLKIPFVDLSHVGGGIPDGIAYVRGRWEWIEIKNREWSYGKKGLNQNQLDWLQKYPCATVYVIESVEDVINLASAHLDRLKAVSV